MNTDGNLAALNQYMKELDAAEAHDEYIEGMQLELADEMYDAYLTGNTDVIDEVNDLLEDPDKHDSMVSDMREAMSRESKLPLNKRGSIIHTAYQNIISEACQEIAKRYKTEDDMERMRREFNI